MGLLPVPLFTTLSLTEPLTLTGVSSTRSRIMLDALGCKVRRVIVSCDRAGRRQPLRVLLKWDTLTVPLLPLTRMPSRAAEGQLMPSLLEADRVLRASDEMELAAVGIEPMGMPLDITKKSAFVPPSTVLSLIFKVFDRIRDGGLAAVQLLIGVDHDGRSPVFGRYSARSRAADRRCFCLRCGCIAGRCRVGVAEAVIENGSGSTCA